MVEEAGLPSEAARISGERVRKGSLKAFHPFSENKVMGAADEQMKMVGHDDVAANGDVERLRARRVNAESRAGYL